MSNFARSFFSLADANIFGAEEFSQPADKSFAVGNFQIWVFPFAGNLQVNDAVTLVQDKEFPSSN